MKVACVIGVRPNYMKVAPILHEIRARHTAGRDLNLQPLLIHTGQHYDRNMSDAVLEDLAMPQPDEFLSVGGGAHAKQTARVLTAFDDVCDKHNFDAVLVVGDVNSTLACALVASKRHMKVVHVEAGLRSFDRTMPEEVNRVLTDQISDLLLITSEDAYGNLEREGIPRDKVRFVGNPMIDSLEWMLQRLPARSAWAERVEGAGAYVVVTLHRPSNVDNIDDLKPILDALDAVGREVPVFFPVHPRTAQSMRNAGFAILESPGDSRVRAGVYGLEPLGYREFLDLMRGASLVITDSGGIQEETTVLGIPCATVRPNTERPVTIEVGTNELVAPVTGAIRDAAARALSGRWKRGTRPPLWDGHAAPRIVDALAEFAARQ
jgi:UDP-N-acetylglucosamine 2-epimerase (non-hydrolysing)